MGSWKFNSYNFTYGSKFIFNQSPTRTNKNSIKSRATENFAKHPRR